MQALQEGISGSSLPLILIHDAGGTIYSYYSLGNLDRSVHAIGNPRFDSGIPWSHGVMEMAQCYYAMIKSRWPKGGVLLGGWSLGGIVALQTAWILARDPALKVHGVVMIDCPFPFQYGAGDNIVLPPSPPGMSDDLRFGLETAVRQSVDMLQDWRPPRWTARQGKPPPIVMLRASAPVWVGEGGGVAMVDKFRSDETLGWERHSSVRSHKVIDLPGNHFSIFDSENAEDLTQALRFACSMLETPSGSDDEENW